MCGIVGYVGKQQAYPILIKGLHRLEYRGYDSAGLALVNREGVLNVFKSKGKVADLEHFVGSGRNDRHRPHPLGDTRRTERHQRPSPLLRFGQYRPDPQWYHRKLPGVERGADRKRLHIQERH